MMYLKSMNNDRKHEDTEGNSWKPWKHADIYSQVIDHAIPLYHYGMYCSVYNSIGF